MALILHQSEDIIAVQGKRYKEGVRHSRQCINVLYTMEIYCIGALECSDLLCIMGNKTTLPAS